MQDQGSFIVNLLQHQLEEAIQKHNFVYTLHKRNVVEKKIEEDHKLTLKWTFCINTIYESQNCLWGN